MRELNAGIISENIAQMCIEANLSLSEDVSGRIVCAEKKENSLIGKKILGQLIENMEIAKSDKIPICQDTGMTVVFVELGQDLHIVGENLNEAINNGIRKGYEEGYLRKSVVKDPLDRINTNDNTPGIIHYSITDGDKCRITVAPKGFGSENMSRLVMSKPADGEDGVRKTVIDTVRLAGPNACPPMVIGVGIGGNFEKCAYLAKKALARNLDIRNENPYYAKLEEELLREINRLNIGPAGLGGITTAIGLNIETYPTHIAGLPVAVNICCHVNRHCTREL